jgi:curved DNA-binding protein CbpA
MNPDDESAKKSFVQIQEAYRYIQMEKDPTLRSRHQKEFNEYQSGSSNASDPNFKSKRPSGGSGVDDDTPGGSSYRRYNHQQDAEEWSQTKFMRRYRAAHLRNKSNVPMSIRNEDRHGLSNLVHEETKIFDKIHFPPFLAIVIITIPVLMFLMNRHRS